MWDGRCQHDFSYPVIMIVVIRVKEHMNEETYMAYELNFLSFYIEERGKLLIESLCISTCFFYSISRNGTREYCR